MIRTFKVEIKPTRKQREQFAKAFGTRRWCWNVLKGDNKLSLSQRTYECKICGNKMDRDVNSAINVYKLASANNL